MRREERGCCNFLSSTIAPNGSLKTKTRPAGPYTDRLKAITAAIDLPNVREKQGRGRPVRRTDDQCGLLDPRVARQSSREPRPQGLPRKQPKQPASHSGKEGSADNWSRPQLSARDQTQRAVFSSREAGRDCLPVAEFARNRCDGRIRSSSIEALTVTGTVAIRTFAAAKKGPRYTQFRLSLAEQVTRPSVRTCAAAHFSPLRAYPFVGCSNFCLLG